MKRDELLTRLGFSVGSYKKKRVLILSDITAEADDPFAIVHHLLSPTEDICGIVAVHSEAKFSKTNAFAHLRGTSVESSYNEGLKILELMELENIPIVKGSQYPLVSADELPESEGADIIIAEALKDVESPLFVACQGALTDLAIALKKCPEITTRMTAILIAGAPYPNGGLEPNIEEDILAAQIVFASELPLWQIPMNVYCTAQLSLSELVEKVKPCGAIGDYLCRKMIAVNDFYAQAPIRIPWPHGETWSIGDNPTVFALLQSDKCWHMERAPLIADDMSYIENPSGREIRVYDSIDNRLGMGDFFSKLKLCYGESK